MDKQEPLTRATTGGKIKPHYVFNNPNTVEETEKLLVEVLARAAYRYLHSMEEEAQITREKESLQ